MLRLQRRTSRLAAPIEPADSGLGPADSGVLGATRSRLVKVTDLAVQVFPGWGPRL
jgi:hypothetical protein